MNKRISQIASVLQKYLSKKIQEDLPESFGLVTVIDVIPTPDLKEARIYISVIQTEKSEEILKILNDKVFEYHKDLKKVLSTRYIPNLHFHKDNSLEKINEVEKILEDIKNGT